MPAPLTWDTPGLAFDSGIAWDSVVPSRTKTMNNTKAIIDFSGYTAPEFGPVAQSIHDKMTANAATFPTPPLAMPALQALITAYDAKLVARASRASLDVLAFNEARAALEQALGGLGSYVNIVAKGDPMTVEKSGFPAYGTAHAPDTNPPAAPTDLRLRQGDLPGTILARYKPDRQPSTNEMQCTTGDPTVDANWHMKGLFQGGRAEMDGFTPGVIVWFRVRSVGLRGVMGAWSDPAQIRVL